MSPQVFANICGHIFVKGIIVSCIYAKKVIICKIFQIDPQAKMLYNKHIERIVRTILFYRNSLIL